jgi:peptidoglycan/xylan/chitin deacetylase (PgdA/CDA1 family)
VKLKTDKKEIAITFDDGPDKNVTPALLEVLNKHKAKAAFFCIGRKIEGNEAVLKKIDSEGHI